MVREADCENEKKIGRVCSVCGEEDPDATVEVKKEGEALGHVPSEEEIEATCSTKGKKVTTCLRCGKILDTEYFDYDKTKHVYGEPTVLQKADCKTKTTGAQQKVCTLCGDTAYDVTPPRRPAARRPRKCRPATGARRTSASAPSARSTQAPPPTRISGAASQKLRVES